MQFKKLYIKNPNLKLKALGKHRLYMSMTLHHEKGPRHARTVKASRHSQIGEKSDPENNDEYDGEKRDTTQEKDPCSWIWSPSLQWDV